MKEKKMYTLTQVSPCKITNENIQMVDTHVTLYQRSYRTFVKALMCKVTAMLIRYNCDMFSILINCTQRSNKNIRYYCFA